VNPLGKFLTKFGWVGLIRLAFYPITALVATPIRLIQTLWSCRVLLDGCWGNYPHLVPRSGLNSLFYWTRALSLHRFGRSGKAPYIGLGNTPLSSMFFYSLPSLYLYWIAGAPMLLLGMFGWWFSHLIWLGDADGFAIGLVLSLALISTMFYGNLALQNYNVFSWAFFPMGVYGLMMGNWMIAGLAMVAASLGGITVVFLGCIFSIVAAAIHRSFFPILAMIPAYLLLAPRFSALLIRGDLLRVVLQVARLIGLTGQKAKYRRVGFGRIGLSTAYFLFLYLQFAIASYFLTGKVPLFFLSGVFIFVVNSTLSRFADEQSMYMVMFTLGTATAILDFDIRLLPSYWLLVSPLPRWIFPMEDGILDIVPLLAPYNIRPLLDGMEEFLMPVRKRQRVLMAFNDPGGVYQNIFDGQRVLLELPLYVSALREIHYLPDWAAVAEINHEGAPDFWGREVDVVMENIKKWRADYVVIYQNGGSDLEPKWRRAGFRPLRKFSWSDYADNLRGILPADQLPDWWLMEVPVTAI